MSSVRMALQETGADNGAEASGDSRKDFSKIVVMVGFYLKSQ
jgi:hypothetical protein